MRLTEVADHQVDDEDLFGEPILSFSFLTRDEEGGELVESEYTFCLAKEWDKWTFSRYRERRCDSSKSTARREWRKTEDVSWGEVDRDPVDVDVPQAVVEKLDEMIDTDVVKLQT